MIRKKQSGRQFSKIDVEEHVNERGEVSELHSINPLLFWGEKNIREHKQKAFDTLKAAGINVDYLLQDSPHGSALRDYVLNYLDHPWDSHIGLAAKILELCCHALAYKEMSADKQFNSTLRSLVHYVTLSQVYETADVKRREGGKASGETSKAKAEISHEKVIKIAKELLESGKERREIAGIISKRVSLSVRQIRSIFKKAGI